MKFLLPLLALALTTTGWAQIDDPHFKTVDEATNKSVREFFKHYEQLYNLHKAHELAAYFGDGGVMHPPEEEFIGRTAIEKHINDSDFAHWHVKNEKIDVNEVKTVSGLVVVTGYWSNTVQEAGGPPINLHGWWLTALQSDDNGGWTISVNNYGIRE